MTKSFMVVETKEAQPFVGYLFQRVFGASPPDYPRHFVCLLDEGGGRLRVAGYAHFSRFEGAWLGGGLVVDKAVYAAVTKEELAAVGSRGSIGEYTVSESIRQLGDDSPVFAYIGDSRSIKVNLDAGYVETHIPKIYAFWKRRYGPEVEHAICERVSRIAPW